MNFEVFTREKEAVKKYTAENVMKTEKQADKMKRIRRRKDRKSEEKEEYGIGKAEVMVEMRKSEKFKRRKVGS